MFKKLLAQLKKGRSFQPKFNNRNIIISFFGAFIAIYLLSIICIYEGQSLLIAPFGASTVILFGISDSPLAQPRNILLGNLWGSVSAVLSFICLGNNALSCGVAVASAIALGQVFRCLHPPAGAVAVLGVLSNAKFTYIFSPVFIGSLVLVSWAIIFNRIFKNKPKYPKHWI